jgi:hypothetical protein
VTLQLGRPADRKYRFKGDKRGMVAEGLLRGPDAHGVFWRPVREYPPEDGRTLVVFAPVHPDDLPPGVR